MAGWRDLEMERGDVADLTPPAGEDLLALRTTPFEEGDDDEGIPLKIGTLGQPTVGNNI